MNKISSLLLVALLSGCDKNEASTASAPSASASPPPAATTPSATAKATETPPPSAPPSASAAAAAPAAKDAVVTIKDASAEPQKTVKVIAGGTLSLFLPDANGTTWSYEGVNKSFGKAKEEVMPGFAPGTNAHQFLWTLKSPPFKAGEMHKLTFANKKAKQTFVLTVQVVAPGS